MVLIMLLFLVFLMDRVKVVWSQGPTTDFWVDGDNFALSSSREYSFMVH